MGNTEFGKFASGKELLHAYLELEKDYTRKCQKLAELVRKMENAEILSNDQNAENEGESNEHSIKNAETSNIKTELTKFRIDENNGGTIENEDACFNSTTCICTNGNDDATEVEKNDERQFGADGADDKRPIYLSPMFGFWAKEFFAASEIAAACEKEILDLVATDYEISCLPNALETAAERVVGKNLMQPVFSDKFVEALCKMPQVKQKVIDLYVKGVRSRGLPPVSIKSRSSMVSPRAKFDSIEAAGKHLLSRL